MEDIPKEQVEVVKPNGEVMSNEETQEFLKKLQAGVFYLPQNR